MQVREVGADGSYLSQSSLIAHFGLGTLEAADSLEIRWPSGAHQVVLHPACNQLLQVTEGTDTRRAAASPK